MANLWSGSINAQDYTTLESLSGITFEQGSTYLIQAYNDMYFRDGTEGVGFLVHAGDKPFEYICGTEDLYVKCANSANSLINIAN